MTNAILNTSSLAEYLKNENSPFHRSFAIQWISRKQNIQDMHQVLTPLMNQYEHLHSSISWLCDLLDETTEKDVLIVVMLNATQHYHAGITLIDASCGKVIDTCVARRSDISLMLFVVRCFESGWQFSAHADSQMGSRRQTD